MGEGKGPREPSKDNSSDGGVVPSELVSYPVQSGPGAPGRELGWEEGKRLHERDLMLQEGLAWSPDLFRLFCFLAPLGRLCWVQPAARHWCQGSPGNLE